VYVTDTAYADLTRKLTRLLPRWEAQAPWLQKKRVDPNKLPRLRFVNAVTWSGFYEMFPMIVAAESLPNDQAFKDKYGTANIVFNNVTKGRQTSPSGGLALVEFVPRREVERYKGMMPDLYLTMVACHELGHTTGGVAIKENPAKLFGTEYSRMEEGRAELFSMWALPFLVDEGVISQEQEVAGYYSMLQALLVSMRLRPLDHSGARNMMFHYFLRTGAVVEQEEDGKTKYAVNPEKMRQHVPVLLGQLGNIKATGNLDELARLKGEYISDADQGAFQRRMEHIPLGLGTILPNMVHDGRRFTRQLDVPSTYRGQRRSLENFL
jgi:hypothetical protein